MASDEIMALTKARSLLAILLATCEQTLLALDAAANVLDTGMTEDLRRMIERTRHELSVMDGELQSLRSS